MARKVWVLVSREHGRVPYYWNSYLASWCSKSMAVRFTDEEKNNFIVPSGGEWFEAGKVKPLRTPMQVIGKILGFLILGPIVTFLRWVGHGHPPKRA
jgi:hypothetical protein